MLKDIQYECWFQKISHTGNDEQTTGSHHGIEILFRPKNYNNVDEFYSKQSISDSIFSTRRNIKFLITNIATIKSRVENIHNLFFNIHEDVIPELIHDLTSLYNHLKKDNINLILEVVEYKRRFSKKLINSIKKLTSIGVEFALDDMMTSEKKLMLQSKDLIKYVKIIINTESFDRKFIKKCIEEKIKIIIEKVEFNHQLELLIDDNINLYQGYLNHKPEKLLT